MDKTEEKIREILNNLNYLFEAHDGFAVLAECSNNRAVIYCGGLCSHCDSKCIEEAIKAKIPDIEVIVRQEHGGESAPQQVKNLFR